MTFVTEARSVVTGWAAVPSRRGDECWYVNLNTCQTVRVLRDSDGAPVLADLWDSYNREDGRRDEYSAASYDLTHLVETLDALTGQYRCGRGRRDREAQP